MRNLSFGNKVPRRGNPVAPLTFRKVELMSKLFTRSAAAELQKLFDDLSQISSLDEQDRLIENEACKHKNSIRELCQDNAELKRKIWEYENNYRVGRYPTTK